MWLNKIVAIFQFVFRVESNNSVFPLISSKTFYRLFQDALGNLITKKKKTKKKKDCQFVRAEKSYRINLWFFCNNLPKRETSRSRSGCLCLFVCLLWCVGSPCKHDEHSAPQPVPSVYAPHRSSLQCLSTTNIPNQNFFSLMWWL